MKAQDTKLKQIIEHVDNQLKVSEHQQKTDSRIEQLLLRLDHHYEQMKMGFAYIEKRFEQIEKRFEQIDKRFDQVAKQFELFHHNMDKRFGEMQHNMDKRFELQNSMFRWQFGTLVTLIIGIYLKLFHIL